MLLSLASSCKKILGEPFIGLPSTLSKSSLSYLSTMTQLFARGTRHKVAYVLPSLRPSQLFRAAAALCDGVRALGEGFLCIGLIGGDSNT
jgi:hypothetical protein